MTTSTPFVSDQVWAQLDPTAGRLTRRDRRWLALGTVALVLVSAAFVVGRESGELHPRVTLAEFDWSEHPSSHTLVARYGLRNEGWFDETVTGFDETATDIDLTKASATHFVIRAGSTHSVTLTFHVRDCSNVETDQPHVRVRLDRFWGTTTATLPHQSFDPIGPIAELCAHI